MPCDDIGDGQLKCIRGAITNFIGAEQELQGSGILERKCEDLRKGVRPRYGSALHKAKTRSKVECYRRSCAYTTVSTVPEYPEPQRD